VTTTSIEVDREGPVTILRIAGDVTSTSEAAFTEAFADAMDDGTRALVLDFAALSSLDSAGIGLLAMLLVSAQRSGVRLLASGLSEHDLQALSRAGLDDGLEIHDDEADAVAAVGV